ncbi:hypothetical protein HYPSUDRAFT_332882 [Hypholoma sublateritium FD-334 SS-4]|uniref:Secreted protein n=1 Tax=Hypholoma sublateritium (strain FD-334 SS-4) TaxID=945553 RepID=A0A0D2P652_HYPSF|nr:hypothetical protein HYPSUDRAFT_332882 [Hypholoma sublateritium FD-334 SS-4]
MFPCIWALVLFLFVSYIVRLTCHSLNSCGQFAMKFFIPRMLFYNETPLSNLRVPFASRHHLGTGSVAVCRRVANSVAYFVHLYSQPTNAVHISADLSFPQPAHWSPISNDKLLLSRLRSQTPCEGPGDFDFRSCSSAVHWRHSP